MKYISIGAVMNRATEHNFEVSHCGRVFTLTGELARMWLSGRFMFSDSENILGGKTLRQLSRMGLAISAEPDPAGEYRTLTKCKIVPAKRKNPYAGLFGKERILMRWMNEAGMVLTMGELVFLMDRKIPLDNKLLGPENRQSLVETIYTKETIFDNILENQMEHAAARDETVRLVLSLLKKKRLVLL